MRTNVTGPVQAGIDWEASAALFLVVGLALGCVFRLPSKRRDLSALLKVIWTDYRSVVWCFAGLSVLTIALGLFVDSTASGPSGFAKTTAASVFASLVENLGFFSLLGFVLLIVQRREADRNRSLDDKIDLVFNAKALRPGEISFLRDQLRHISADCRTLEVEIDVVEHDSVSHFVRIDVSRKWLVANYLRDESAVYEFKSKTTADAAPGRSPSMSIYPAFTTTLVADGRGRWRTTTDDETLHDRRDLDGGAVLEVPARPLDIDPGCAREFRTRFNGWQRLFVVGPVPTDDGYGPVRSQADHFSFNIFKHWDEVRLATRNSLNVPLAVSISQSDGASEMRLIRKVVLEPGDKQREPFLLENLPANSRVYVSFEPR